MIFKEEWNLIKEDGDIDFDKTSKRDIEIMLNRLKNKDSIDVQGMLDDTYELAKKQQDEFFEVNAEEILKNSKRFDYAFLIDFGDNDFCGYIEDFITKRLSPMVEQYLTAVGYFFNEEYVEGHLEEIFNKEYLFNYLKRGFISEYVLNEEGYGIDNDDIEETCKKAIGYLDYLFKEDKLIVGTNKEIDEYIITNYSSQNEPIIDRDIDTWWFNGEVCIVRIKDNKLLIPTIKYEN